jgi:hypothetical protein
MVWRRDAAIAVAIIAGVWATSPADACHRYAVWHYRFPQRCYTAYAPIPQKRELAQTQHPVAPPTDYHSWYVDITKMPPLDDATGRALGVEELKRKLGGQAE